MRIQMRGLELVENRIEMSRTRTHYYASNNQPRLIVESLLKLPFTLSMLEALRKQRYTGNEIAPNKAMRERLRQLRQVNLITAYEIAGVIYYRATRLPPYVQLAIDNHPKAAA